MFANGCSNGNGHSQAYGNLFMTNGIDYSSYASHSGHHQSQMAPNQPVFYPITPMTSSNNSTEEWARRMNHQLQIQTVSHVEQTEPSLTQEKIESQSAKPVGPKRKIKKSRVLFSQWQINELEKLFKKQKYVTANERELISKRLRLNANQVCGPLFIALISIFNE